MYEQVFHFFGLRENPFHVSPDGRRYFATRAHTQAFQELTAAVQAKRGVFLLTGEAGTGKTTLLRHFLDWLETRNQSSCYVFHSQLKPWEFIELILQDFGVPCNLRDKHEVLLALNQWLLERRRLGDAPVLLIDEGQAIPVRTLKRLNLFLNLEANGEKLLQIVLAGQPELETKLRRAELWQLEQRIISRCRLLPLSLDETAAYVKSRMENNGASSGIFSDGGLEVVHVTSRGIPRVINLLCEHALIMAYSENTEVVTPEVIWRVAADFDLNTFGAVLAEAALRFGPLNTVGIEKEKREDTARSESAEIAEVELESSSRAIAVKKWPFEPTVSQEREKPREVAAPTSEPKTLTLPTVPEQLREPLPASTVPVTRTGGLPWQKWNVSRNAGIVGRRVVAKVRIAAVGEAGRLAAAIKKNVLSTKTALQTRTDSLKRKRIVSRTTKPLPVNWKRPSALDGIIDYWQGVQDSFVRDWNHFFQAHAAARKSAGGNTARKASA